MTRYWGERDFGEAPSSGQSQFGGGVRKQTQWAGRHRENHAKQTQFLAGGEEGQVSCGKGVMVNWTCNRPRQNKANCPKRGTEAVSRLRISDCGLNTEWERRRPAVPGPVVQTKPIPAGAELELNNLQEKSYAVCTCVIGAAKQSQFPPPCRSGDRRSRETNGAKQSRFPNSGEERARTGKVTGAAGP